jgi:transposase
MHVHEHLTPEQLRAWAKRHSQKRRIWVRFQAVVLAHQGRTAPDIAEALGVSRRAVQEWVAKYNRGGSEALLERPRPGRPRRLGPDCYDALRQRLDAPARPEDGVCALRGADIRRLVEREFAVALSLRSVYNLLGYLDYSSLMPRPQHKDADDELQAIYQEVVNDQIQAIEQAHPDKEVRTYFHDEARFGQQGTITRVWAPRGSRPRAVRQTQYTSLFVLVAICVSTGAPSALIVPELHTGAINAFLEQLSRELPSHVHAVVIWDQAGYHTGAGLVVPSNISLILLPPHSPELNPVENLWHYLRSHHWSNRMYRDYNELEAEAIRSLCKVCLDAELVKSICAAPYIRRSA